ncbi:hypothetical protein ACFQ14_03285 [Pseudahrensia aquimaris]|uniref:Uncharacterized protein n=1 Tax=Pseudahrensia aquimaris TaxID=744461 RepID=A0ABW3FDA6_9HYPH
MGILKALSNLFFLPGTLVLHALGISVEDDSGILRSLLNSFFWGAVALAIALQYFI